MGQGADDVCRGRKRSDPYWFPGVVPCGWLTRYPQIYLTWISSIDYRTAASISRMEGEVIPLPSPRILNKHALQFVGHIRWIVGEV